MVAALREPGITSLRVDGRGRTEPESARVVPVDRSGYPSLVEKGQVLLARVSADWPLEETPHVLAALADECGDPLLAARILDLGAFVSCAYCGGRLEVSDGLRVL
jgi:hypothetical protein